MASNLETPPTSESTVTSDTEDYLSSHSERSNSSPDGSDQSVASAEVLGENVQPAEQHKEKQSDDRPDTSSGGGGGGDAGGPSTSKADRAAAAVVYGGGNVETVVLIGSVATGINITHCGMASSSSSTKDVDTKDASKDDAQRTVNKRKMSTAIDSDDDADEEEKEED